MMAHVTGSISADDELNFAEDNGFDIPDGNDKGFMSLEWDGLSFAVFFDGPSAPGIHSDVEVSLYAGEEEVIAYSTEVAPNNGSCVIIVQSLRERTVSGGVFCPKLLGVKTNEDGTFQPLEELAPSISLAATFEATVEP